VYGHGHGHAYEASFRHHTYLRSQWRQSPQPNARRKTLKTRRFLNAGTGPVYP
jgi:hypothetical protein